MDTQESAAAASTFVGIDVSKAALDVALRPSGEHWRSTNDEAGIAELIGRLRPLAPGLIVLEATGGLERLVVKAITPFERDLLTFQQRTQPTWDGCYAIYTRWRPEGANPIHLLTPNAPAADIQP